MKTMWIWLLVGCRSVEHGHEHGPDAHEPAVVKEAPARPQLQARHGGHAAALGEGVAEVVLAEGHLRLYVADGAGAAVKPEGDARVVFTPHGAEEQRLVLKPAGDHWAATADASDSGGLAIVNVTFAGLNQTARIAWGEAAQHGHEQGDHDEHGTDHDQGDHGHDH